MARRARATDAEDIHELISQYADQGLLLPRALEEVRAHTDRFLVLEEAADVVGCVALEPYGTELAEVRSLAVDPRRQGRGLGGRLLRFALGVARRRKVARVFAVTHAPEFFQRLGFLPTTRQAVPEKIERDCRACPKQPTCRLVAVVRELFPERLALPVLTEDQPTVS